MMKSVTKILSSDSPFFADFKYVICFSIFPFPPPNMAKVSLCFAVSGKAVSMGFRCSAPNSVGFPPNPHLFVDENVFYVQAPTNQFLCSQTAKYVVALSNRINFPYTCL